MNSVPPIGVTTPSMEIVGGSSNPSLPLNINGGSSNPSLPPKINTLVQKSVERNGELRTISPRKTIFATRFHYDTTVDEIKNFIKNKFNDEMPENLLVFKINTRNRASFKIIVPAELFDQIVNRTFWPKNALVREFIYRDEDLARLPSSANQINTPIQDNPRRNNNSRLPSRGSNKSKN